MTRNGILVSFALCLAMFGALRADDELTITELYGQAVHAYFDGSYEEAHKKLTDAIGLGTEDPRVYYFRGLAKIKLGRAEEGAKDFDQGGKLEAQGVAQYYPIGRSLERIQGAERLAIEKVRKQARIAIRLRQKKIEAARIEAFKRNERLRNTGPPVKLGNPSENSKSGEDPFGTTGKPPTTPAGSGKKSPGTPATENKNSAADPFAVPDKKTEPAKEADPFADPFAEPEPAKKTEPSKSTDPFAAPNKETEPKKNEGSAVASPLPVSQQAQVGLKVDLASAMKSFGAVDQLKQQAGLDVPDSVTSLEVFVNLPSQFAPDPSGFNFHVKLAFSDETEAKQIYDLILQSAPQPQPEKIGDKTYMVVVEPGSPTVYLGMDGASIVASSKAYAESGENRFASMGLQAIMKGLDPDVVQLGIDMKGASSFLNGALGMVPPDEMMQPIVEAVKKIDAMKMTTGIKENLMMLAFDAADEDGAKAIRQQLQKGLALAAAGAALAAPDEKKAPASAEFFTHFMSSLVPKKEGNTIKIVIAKPDNYDELVKKMQKEIEDGSALPPGLLGPGPGGAPGGDPFGGAGDDPDPFGK